MKKKVLLGILMLSVLLMGSASCGEKDEAEPQKHEQDQVKGLLVRSVDLDFYNTIPGSATKIVFDYKSNVDVTDMTCSTVLGGAVGIYNSGTEYYVLSNYDDDIMMKGSLTIMFSGYRALKSIEFNNFNTENVVEMQAMFSGCSSLTDLDLSSFNTENVLNMQDMFSYCSSLTSLDLSTFNTEKVANISSMFSGCSSLTGLNLSTFNTENVTDMNWMFYDCKSLTDLDLSSFNTANVTSMYRTFDSCSSLKTIYAGNKFTTDFPREIFISCPNLVGGQGTEFSSSNPNDKTYARIDDPANGKPGYFTLKK